MSYITLQLKVDTTLASSGINELLKEKRGANMFGESPCIYSFPVRSAPALGYFFGLKLCVDKNLRVLKRSEFICISSLKKIKLLNRGCLYPIALNISI